jgi:hypothetical protein
VAEDEAYVWETHERSGEQKAEDAAVRILREFEQRGRNPAERRCTAERRQRMDKDQ